MGGLLVGEGGAGFHPGNTAFTLAAWFWLDPAAGSGVTYPLLNSWDATGAFRAYALALTGLQVTLRLSVDGTAVFSLADVAHGAVSPGAWHLGIVGFDGGINAFASTDGNSGSVSNSTSPPTAIPSNPLRSGGYPGTPSPAHFFGSISVQGIWTRFFADADKTALWNGGHLLKHAALPPSLLVGLAHYWNMDEQLPGPFADSVAGGFNLDISGTVAQGPVPA
jgi:hypothetical protein